ncbi:MAG: divergent polysaccharide deacetylase family protein [Gammaproteobacteria bacterium]|nr:divergent polysaccharide deacetylase family protein [Gammaproteobacteria bacterium]
MFFQSACLGTLALAPSPSFSAEAKLAIVIDDIGYSVARAQRVIDLPGPITLALLPYAPASTEIAKRATRAGQEVILHQPMEPYPGPLVREVRGTLMLAMRPLQFNRTLSAALAAIPNVRGLNNHTGSLLTQHAEPMGRVMQQLKREGLYFLDSRTTPHTVAHQTAMTWSVPTIARDVFLDHIPNFELIDAQFARALKIARRNGHAVLIGHPHRSSLDFLQRRLRQLPADISLVHVSELVRPRPVMLAQRENPTSQRISLGQ